MNNYTNKLVSLEEVYKFLEPHITSRLNHDEIEYLNKPIRSKKMEPVTKNLPKTKSPGPGGFIGESYQIFKEELTNIISKFFQKIKE